MSDIAHIKLSESGWQKQSIADHCSGTAKIAEHMAEAFGAGPWADLCGLWHDIGKYSDAFQRHIMSSSGYRTEKDPGKTDHSTAGAWWSLEKLKGYSLPIAYCISGHHSGLMDFNGPGRQTLKFHLSLQEKPLLDAVRTHIPNIIIPQLPVPAFDKDSGAHPKAWHLWIRMLFSCLVDADWLDTERFMKPEDNIQRSQFSTLKELKPLLDAYIANLSSHAKKSEVNRVRAEVQKTCLLHGSSPQGIYSLTVPTGGGKTLSSLVWAMQHATKHHLNRIIIAIPYTSIVTQTADTLRKIFGSMNVVEHHSNVDFESLPDENRRSLKLATENWEAPVIVTTNVQLFESLFSNKTSRCRKLHNISRSVLILDEVQMLPVENLQPIVDVLDSLSKFMHTSILLTTATQPALSGVIGTGDAAFKGLESKEIISDKKSLFEKMRRVEIHFEKETFSLEELAQEISQQSQVLCVVNTRREAQQLYEALPDKEHAFHLSRMMCQQHISDTLAVIRHRLDKGDAVQVISTQLIEAGVDIDFPTVWREMAGLDSIAQSAGRCNREGKADKGLVHVFCLEGPKLRGVMAKAEKTAQDLIDMGKTDFLNPMVAEDYFRRFYARINSTDKEDITKDLYRPEPQFAEAASKFKMIDDCSLTVYVPYGNGEELLRRLRDGEYSPALLRQLQRYSVSVPPSSAETLGQIGSVRLGDNIYSLPDSSHYNDRTGLTFDNHWLRNELIL